MNEFQVKVLDFLSINEDDLAYLTREITKKDIESFTHFINIDRAKERILKSIENKEKIMIYGDYDCDGICATSILVKMFSYLGVKVGYYIPSRYIDGYGITLDRAKQIKEKNYSLVITVDNGVAAFEALEYLHQNHIDVILTDHHEITREIPACYTLVHSDKKNKDNDIKQCGGYVALMLANAVLGYVDDYLCFLASISTVGDMMPIRKYNRDLLKYSLSLINQNKHYPVHLLIKNSYVNEETLSFQICPKINAFGRMKEDTSVNDMVRFFVDDDYKVRQIIAINIENVNEERKKAINNAYKLLAEKNFSNDKIIIQVIDNIEEGIIGLLAARLLQEYQRPSIILTSTKEIGLYKGSARSINGFSLSKAFSECEDLLFAYGGHEEAGGLSIKEENIPDFIIRMNELIKDQELIVDEEKSILIDKKDVTYDNYLFIRSLSPFGIDYECPRFKLNIDTSLISFMGNNNQHIRGKLNYLASFVGFSCADKCKNKSFITVIGKINYDDFRKGKNVVFQIEKIL